MKAFLLCLMSDSSLMLTVKEFSFSKTPHFNFVTEEIIKGLHKTINISVCPSDDLSDNRYRIKDQKRTSNIWTLVFHICYYYTFYLDYKKVKVQKNFIYFSR